LAAPAKDRRFRLTFGASTDVGERLAAAALDGVWLLNRGALFDHRAQRTAVSDEPRQEL
jgi:hypothetical protein